MFGKKKKTNRERILALDLLRGTFLAVIVATHIAWKPSLFTFIGGGGELFASAAEGFFTISGLLVGYLYGPRVLQSTNKVFIKIWKRALLLYGLATFFTLFYTAWAVLDPESSKYATLYTRDAVRFIVDTFTLRYAFGWAEFLNRYALFMFVAPFAVWLIAKGKAWIVALISFLIWLFLRSTDRFLPFSSWQLVFMFGIILGYYLPAIEDWFRKLNKQTQRNIFISVVSVAVVSYVYSMWLFVIAPLALPATNHWVIQYHQWAPYFDKDHLAPARVAVGVVWFAALYMVYRRYEKQISKYSYGVLEVLGRNSLFVYTLHAFLLFIIDLYFFPPVGPVTASSIFASTGVVLMVLIIIYFVTLNRSHINKLRGNLFRNRSTTETP